MSNHQVFISYSSIDTVQAMDICKRIEDNGFTCWIAPRNEQAGTSFGQQITNAIKQAQVVVLVFTAASNKSQHVLNEVGLAFDDDKKIIPFLLDETEMCADMRYYLSRKHHIKASFDLNRAFQELIESIRGYIPTIGTSISDETEKKATAKDCHLTTELTEALINSSMEYSVAVRRFHDIIKGIPNWTQQERILSKAKEIIAYSFIGVVGKLFSKLIAISKDTDKDKYAKFCLTSKRICIIITDLFIFAIISRLWDNVTTRKQSIGSEITDMIRKRLMSPYELSLLERLDILDAMIQLCDTDNLPIPELKNVQAKLQTAGPVHEAFETLSKINVGNITLEDCQLAEKALTEVLISFNFLMRYKIVSMKWSRYEKTRTDPTKFMHRYVVLGLDNKANVDLEKVNFTDSAITTDSVMMYVGDITEENNINLYPLVIDLNTLYREQGSKICFFNLNPMTDSSLEYSSLEDNSKVFLDNKKIKQKVENISDLFASKEDLVTYNMDNVVDTFNQLQNSLLGETYVDFGDL